MKCLYCHEELIIQKQKVNRSIYDNGSYFYLPKNEEEVCKNCGSRISNNIKGKYK